VVKPFSSFIYLQGPPNIRFRGILPTRLCVYMVPTHWPPLPQRCAPSSPQIFLALRMAAGRVFAMIFFPPFSDPPLSLISPLRPRLRFSLFQFLPILALLSPLIPFLWPDDSRPFFPFNLGLPFFPQSSQTLCRRVQLRLPSTATPASGPSLLGQTIEEDDVMLPLDTLSSFFFPLSMLFPQSFSHGFFHSIGPNIWFLLLPLGVAWEDGQLPRFFFFVFVFSYYFVFPFPLSLPEFLVLKIRNFTEPEFFQP